MRWRKCFTCYIYWKAHKITGACGTTAQVDTLEGALTKHVAKKETQQYVCAVQCYKLRHAGKWTAYVAYGTDRHLVENLKCDHKAGEYSSCTSGVNGSVHKGLKGTEVVNYY